MTVINLINLINVVNIMHLEFFIKFLEFILFLKKNYFMLIDLFKFEYYYMKDFDYFQNMKKNKDFKIIINNYILNDYFIFNNFNGIKSSNLKLFINQQQWSSIAQIIFLNLEIFLIGSQKLIYEYIDYIKPLWNWYSNYKILIYKNLGNITLLDTSYPNISLDLLLDVQNENNKSLIWLIQNKEHFNRVLIKKAIIKNLNDDVKDFWYNIICKRDFRIPENSWFGLNYTGKYIYHWRFGEWKILRDWYKTEVCDTLYNTWIYNFIYAEDRYGMYSPTIYKDINHINLKKQAWIKIFENFNKIFKKKPYKIFVNISNLNNQYSRTNLLTYGLTHDLNIFTEKNYKNANILKYSWKQISHNDILLNKIINNSIQTWYSIYNKPTDITINRYELFQENIYLSQMLYNLNHEDLLWDNPYVPKSIKLKGFFNETFNRHKIPKLVKFEKLKNKWDIRAGNFNKYLIFSMNYLHIIHTLELSKIYSKIQLEIINPLIIEAKYYIIPRIYHTIRNLIPNAYENILMLKEKMVWNKKPYNNLSFFSKIKNKNYLIELPFYSLTEALENKTGLQKIYNLNKSLNKISNFISYPLVYINNKILYNIIDHPLVFISDKMGNIGNIIGNIIGHYSLIFIKNNLSLIDYAATNSFYYINKAVSSTLKKTLNYALHNLINATNIVNITINDLNIWKNLSKNSAIINTNLGGYSSMYSFVHDEMLGGHKKEKFISTYGFERLVYSIPYNWIKVDIQDMVESVNQNNYLWVWKNPANIQSLHDLNSYFSNPETSIVNRKIVLVSELDESKKLNSEKSLEKFGLEDSSLEDLFYSRLYQSKYRKLIEDFNENIVIKKIDKTKDLSEKEYLNAIINMERIYENNALFLEEHRKKRIFGQLFVKEETDLDRWIQEKDPLNLSGRWKGTEFYMSQLFWTLDKIYYYENGQKPWSVIFEDNKYRDFSKITTVQALNEYLKIEQFTEWADQELEHYPKDILWRYYTIINEKQKIHNIINLNGYWFLQANKHFFKTALSSNDIYITSYREDFSLNEVSYRKSFFMKDFRRYKNDVVFSLKKEKEALKYWKFLYNKPDIATNLNPKVSFTMIRPRTQDVDPYIAYSNLWDLSLSKLGLTEMNKSRKVKVNTAFYWLEKKENLYDFIHLEERIKFAKKDEYFINKLLLKKLSILKKSKDAYKLSINNGFDSIKQNYIHLLYENYEKLIAERYLKKNMFVTWDVLYTQIEGVTESLNLNIINKKIYGASLNHNIKILPQNTNILLQKKYIIQLLNVYQKEEQSINYYIFYKIKRENFKIKYDLINLTILNFFNDLKFILSSSKKNFYFFSDFIIDALFVKLLEYKEIKRIVKYYNFLNINYDQYIIYILIMFFILVYCLISALLIVLIKSFIPKNLIYGIKIKSKKVKFSNFEPLNEASKFIEDLSIDDLYDKKNLQNIDNIDDINLENIKKFTLQKKLNNLNLKKNFFDPEIKYVYSWESRYEENNLLKKGIKNLKKIKIYNKFEAQKKKDLKKNYVIFYKKFFFEKNLEKWENNTKFRLEDPLDWYAIINSWFFRFKKLFEVFRRDKRYNHNRIVFWEDPSLDEWTKITYVYIIPKPFFNFFFVIKFIIGSIKLWNYSYWIRKWKQYVMYGVRTKISYKELREHLEKEWSLEWYKDNSDYDASLYLKNMMKFAKKYNFLKKKAFNAEIGDKQEKREQLLENIITLILEEEKLKTLKEYLTHLNKIKSDRIENSFDKKFANINKKFILDADQVDSKKWVEQQIRHKYREIIFNKKLEIEKEEYKTLKQSYSKKVQHNADDKNKSLEILEVADEKKIKIAMEKKLALLEYEKNLRDYNFENNVIDEALDIKEKVFFESIKEYNEDLSEAYLKHEEDQKKEKIREQITQKRAGILYSIYDKYYPYYRKWTTMGARINYILAQIIMIFAGWVDNFKRIRKNEYNVQNIFKIIWIDLLQYIYKMYWEFIIIFKEYNSLKNWGLNIKTILKFSIIFLPILIYSTILYLILFFFFWWNFLFKKKKKIISNILNSIYNYLNKIIKNYLQFFYKKIVFFIKEIQYYFNYLYYIFKFLFKNLETGNTIIDDLYLKFYKICAWIQRNIYFIKGAFILKYNENKKISEGLYSVKKYLILKYNSYIELKKKNKKWNWKNIILKKKENIVLKIELLLILLDIKFWWKKHKEKNIWKIYKYIVYPIYKMDWNNFYKLFKQNMELYEKIKKEFIKKITLIFFFNKFKSWELIKIVLINTFKLIMLPFSYIIKHQQNKYINNYKKGIQGFRDNPMHLIIDKPKPIYNWKVKLHNILMKRKVSKYLQVLLETQSSLIEIFFMFKILEVKWTKKNYYQDFFWKKWYWYLKTYKKKFLNWLIEYVLIFEESYQNFEESLETQNWTFWERIKYAYYTYKMYNHVMTRSIQRDISRNIFFYKKVKERDRLIRIYFIKGIINWVSYVTINKIIFTNIKDLKHKKIKAQNFKYYIRYIKGSIHLSGYIEEVPPQFWALIIIYNKYYRLLLKYIYNDPTFPKKWEENKDLEYKKDYKWRLASSEHNYDIPFYDRRFIAADINSFHFKEFISSLANQPYDPLIRWILFLLEYGLSKEVLIEEGNKKFIDNKENIWGDISLSHLLTYNKNLDEYNYEIKEFNRLIEGVDSLKVTEHTLERDKANHYFDRFKKIKENIILKNEDILQNILKQRRLKKAKMLHKALLRNKLKTAIELEEEQEEENKKEYFYVKKKEFFEDLLIEQYWNWQSQYDSKNMEDKYFSWDDLWDATYNAHNAEEYYLSQGKLINYNYLIDHIVLLSFDETLEEIYSFLMLKIWKNLEKELNNQQKTKYINYKHLQLDDNILYRLNYTEHLQSKKVKIEDKKNKKSLIKTIYEYTTPKIEWESLKINPLYNYIENNLLWMYYEIGDVFTYQEKIEFNIEASRYQRKDRYHEQEILSKLLNILLERKKNLKNIKRVQIIKKLNKTELNFARINNIKWTWEQWLIYNNIENENKILNKKIIVLNEKYNLWNLKRIPVRIKLPVILDVDDERYIKNFLEDTDHFISYGFYLMSSTVTPILKQSLEWEQCKIFLEKHFNKNIKDIILWVFTADLFNKEALKVKRDYKFVLKNFTQNYGVFHKLYFLGLPHYSWDLLRYHEIWIGQEEFPYHKYFQLKQMEFLNHDPAAKKIIEKLHNLFIDKYKPINFIFFFKYQFFYNYISPLLNIIILGNFILLIKVIFYSPGEFLGNNYLLFTPLLFLFFCFYFKKKFKKIKDLNKGLELYLYKYRSSKMLSAGDWQKIQLNLDRNKKAWIEHFYDRDKIYEIFGPLGYEALSIQKDVNWWRYYTHLTKNNEVVQSRQFLFILNISIIYFLMDFWGWYKHRYRNSKWVWDYYRVDDLDVEKAKKMNVHVSKGFNERLWIEDSWARLENGNSLFCQWYENYYRKFRHLPFRELDYGNVGTAKEIDFQLYYKGWREHNREMHYMSGFSDSHWNLLSRYLEKRIFTERKAVTTDRIYPSQVDYKDLLKDLAYIYHKTDKWKSLDEKNIVKVLNVKYKNLYDENLQSQGIDWASYYQNLFFRKEIAISNENYLNYMDSLKKYDILKKNINLSVDRLIEDYWVWKLGKLYDIYYPKENDDKWPIFIQWVKDEYRFDLQNIENLYTKFLMDLHFKIDGYIKKDFKRYLTGKDVGIFGNYYDKKKEKNVELYISHRECFTTGKPLDINILLEIADKEKHYHNFCYHMVKYKLDKIIIFKEVDPSLLFKIYNVPNKCFLPEINNRLLKLVFNESEFNFWKEKYLLITHKLLPKYIQTWKIYKIDSALVEYLQRKGRYIKNINKEVLKSEVADYKIKLLINFIKEKTNFWFFLENFSLKLDIIEFVIILIKLIFKIFS